MPTLEPIMDSQQAATRKPFSGWHAKQWCQPCASASCGDSSPPRWTLGSVANAKFPGTFAVK